MPVVETLPEVLPVANPELDDEGTLAETPPSEREAPGDPMAPFGRCPNCGKPLLPKNKETGKLQAPVALDAYLGRACCIGCRALLQYLGNGQWEILGGIGIAPDDIVSPRNA